MSPNSHIERGNRLPWVPIALWTLFAVGLGLQFFSPHLQIVHDSFVIPLPAKASNLPIDPRALVRQERLVQTCSALLVLAGAVGLAIYFRGLLVRSLFQRESL